jgi:hypothetical protein
MEKKNGGWVNSGEQRRVKSRERQRKKRHNHENTPVEYATLPLRTAVE